MVYYIICGLYCCTAMCTDVQCLYYQIICKPHSSTLQYMMTPVHCVCTVYTVYTVYCNIVLKFSLMYSVSITRSFARHLQYTAMHDDSSTLQYMMTQPATNGPGPCKNSLTLSNKLHKTTVQDYTTFHYTTKHQLKFV